MTSVLLNAFYDFGDIIGPILCGIFGILLTVMIVYVMVVYLFPKAK